MSKVMLCLEEEREEIKEDGNWCTSSCILGRGARPKSNGERKQKTQNLQQADDQIPRERKCKSKKDKANNSLFGRGRGKTQLPNQLLSCNKNCLLTAWISGSLSLNLFLVLTPKSFTGACSSSLNCFTIAQWKKSLFWYSRRVDYETQFWIALCAPKS